MITYYKRFLIKRSMQSAKLYVVLLNLEKVTAVNCKSKELLRSVGLEL